MIKKNRYGGFVGEGKYKSTENKKTTRCYKIWDEMLKRCHNEKYQNEKPTYIGCTICEEWYNFQNFAEWYEKNYYKIENEIVCLDKDILVKGNKIYSPETCIFVPNRINILFTKSNKTRGEYPIGIYCYKQRQELRVRCNTLKGSVYLGRFELDEVNEAFLTYKKFKENYIKEVADEYKDLIPIELYNAMYNYKVDIND